MKLTPPLQTNRLPQIFFFPPSDKEAEPPSHNHSQPCLNKGCCWPAKFVNFSNLALGRLGVLCLHFFIVRAIPHHQLPGHKEFLLSCFLDVVFNNNKLTGMSLLSSSWEFSYVINHSRWYVMVCVLFRSIWPRPEPIFTSTNLSSILSPVLRRSMAVTW